MTQAAPARDVDKRIGFPDRSSTRARPGIKGRLTGGCYRINNWGKPIPAMAGAGQGTVMTECPWSEFAFSGSSFFFPSITK